MSNNRRSLASIVISPCATLSDAIAQLESVGTGALVVCSENRKLYGLIADGDVRRALLEGRDLREPCSTVANRTPIVACAASAPLTPGAAKRLMTQHDIDHLPVINVSGELVDFLLRRELGGDSAPSQQFCRPVDDIIIEPTISVADAIAKLNSAGSGVLLLCDQTRKLCGVITDGDVRRAVLRGSPLTSPCEVIAARHPTTAPSTISHANALRLMNQRDIDQLPLLDESNNVVGVMLRRDLVDETQPNPSAVIMVGGFGTRLLPLTRKVPKPMLPLGDRPLLERTIAHLRYAGICDITLTTHYLAEFIKKYFGDGSGFGVRLNYVKEEQPLGTAGSLKMLNNWIGPKFVLNGDIVTNLPFQDMLSFHRKHGAEITVGVRKYDVKVPFGVVESEDFRTTHLKEKPSLSYFINAGVYLLEPSVWDDIPQGQRYDMTDLIQTLLDAGRSVVSFPIIEYWRDVGQHEDYRKAQEDIRNGRI